MSKVENGDDQFWLVRGRVGIKVFPRCGSTTLREAYGHGSSRKFWMRAKHHVIVVRDPWERLMSVWNGMQQAGDKSLQALGYLNTDDFNAWLAHILAKPSAGRDWHTRAFSHQLMGYQPQPEELWLLKDVVAAPPYDLPKITKHHHRTRDHMRIAPEVDKELFKKWKEEYQDDILMAQTAALRSADPS